MGTLLNGVVLIWIPASDHGATAFTVEGHVEKAGLKSDVGERNYEKRIQKVCKNHLNGLWQNVNWY